MKRKKDYPTTDETRDVLNGSEASIAKAYPCDASYIYNIKNMNEPDPYAPFREWFQVCAIGGGKVEAYLHDLSAIAFRAKNGVLAENNLHIECLKTIDRKAGMIQKLVQIIEDGKVDETDCGIILKIVHAAKTDLKKLENLALDYLNKCERKREIGDRYFSDIKTNGAKSAEVN